MMAAVLLPTFDLQSLAQLSAERILNCTAEGMGIALLAWVLLRALGRQNSGTRFAVWFAALLGIAALPLVGHWTSGGAGLARRSEITIPSSWALYIFAAWALIAALGLLRVGIGFVHLHRLRKRCAPVDVAALEPVLRETLEEFDSPRAVKLCVSDELRVPTAIGFMEPMVVIPSWTMQELSIPELNTILLHELAHLRRRDDWTNLIQKILGALLFFHPAVWWIEKKLALEREMACDDLVLAQTQATNPRAYAKCLVSLAEKSFLRRGLALAQAAVDRVQQVSLRVSQILDVNRPSATRVWRPAPFLVTGASLVCLLALSHSPTRLISFEDSAPAAASVSNAVASGNIESSQISEMGGHIVSAKLDLRPLAAKAEQKSSLPVVAKAITKSKFARSSNPAVVPAQATARRAQLPTLIRTSVADDAIAPRTLFLVMQTEILQTRQYGANGSVVWELCVWQVTVVGSAQSKLEPGAIAKSI